ncbi:PREDICTED: myb-like protein V [Brassica oleracea var. oleracea]|uniref:myb-like protein V n=1 Tax=Brassica oleracea var. oleracea TaxID=109376 RepID=UPI0006A6AAF2|nr:PREDICTED: myb-like protein V [Brassica oleracea var. oleracea]
MEEDTAAILKKMNAAAKPTTDPKAPEARQEPRQHAKGNKSNQQKSFFYVVEDKNPPPGSTVVVREKANVELPKSRQNNTKSWSKTKERKDQKSQDKAGARPKRAEDDKPEEQDEDEGKAQVKEEHPRNRRRVQVILARPSSSSDEEEDSKVHDSHERSNKRPSENGKPEESNDLRNKLRRKSQTIDRVHDSKNDLRSIIKDSKAKRVEDSSVQTQLKPRVLDLRDQLNSKLEDLMIKLNRPKRSNLRRKLEETKARNGDKHEPIIEDSPKDLRVQLQNRWIERAPFLNVIMGGSPPCGDSVRSIKDHRRQAITSKEMAIKT